MAHAELAWLDVEVVYSPAPGRVDRVALRLPAPATASDALLASGLVQRYGLALPSLTMGIWGRRCEPAAILRERDRIEVYRPLLVDPKEARRLRYQKHRPAAAAPGGRRGDVDG